jgi:hypothetical protein
MIVFPSSDSEEMLGTIEENISFIVGACTEYTAEVADLTFRSSVTMR